MGFIKIGNKQLVSTRSKLSFSSSSKISSSSSFKLATAPIMNRKFSTGLKFTKEHEWIRVDKDIGTVGISDFAQKALGDVVFVDLPAVGTKFSKKETIVAVESVKAANDVYAPVSGTVTEVNKSLSETPALVNESAYEKGWMIKLKLSNPTELSQLLNELDYKKHCESEAH